MKIKINIALAALFIVTSLGAQAYIGYVYPTGGQQGKSIEVIVGGQQLSSVTGVYVNGKGITGTIVEIIPVNLKEKNLRIKEQDIPQIEEKVKVRIDIKENAEIGIHDFRLVTKSGYTNRIFFEVNNLPEMNEVEPNDKPENACVIPKLPIVVNGQILPGERDCFRFNAKTGQTIVCYTKARLLVPYLADAVPGWFQPILTLRNADNKEVAYDDDFGDNPDPVIIYSVPQTGYYSLEIKDAVYRGREDFVYRISIGEIPFVRSIFPLGCKMGKSTKITLDGVNLAKNTKNVKAQKTDENKVYFTVENKGIYSNKIAFGISTGDELFKNQNNSFSNPLFISPDDIVNGVIQHPGQEDWYVMEVNKDENIVVEIMAHRLGSLLDADLTLYNESNKVLAQMDDFEDKSEGMETFHADPQMVYKFLKTGKVYIRVRDVLGKGGKEYGYRLNTGKPTPDFDLRINPSNLTINQGGTSVFTVSAIRKFNFKGDITLKLTGLPSKYTTSSTVFKKGQNQLRMTLTAPENAGLGAIDLKIKGRSETKNSTIERNAEPVEEQMQAFHYKHLLPTRDFLATVVPPLPFSISHSIPNDSVLKLVKDSAITFNVKVKRSADFKLPIQLTLDGPKNGLKMKPVIVPVDQSEAMVTLVVNTNLYNQNLNLVISGISRTPKTKKTKATVIKALSPAIMAEGLKQMGKQNWKQNGNKKK